MGCDMVCASGSLTVLFDHESNRLVRQLLTKTVYEKPSYVCNFFRESMIVRFNCKKYLVISI